MRALSKLPDATLLRCIGGFQGGLGLDPMRPRSISIPSGGKKNVFRKSCSRGVPAVETIFYFWWLCCRYGGLETQRRSDVEILASLGIREDQLKVSLKNPVQHNTIVLWGLRRARNWALMKPRDASLSDSYTSDRCNFFQLCRYEVIDRKKC